MASDTITFTSQAEEMPSKTYKIDWVNGTIGDFIDGTDAIAQSVELALTTERFVWRTYTWNYGSEIYTLIGKNDDYIVSEMKRMIEDALSTDSRIKEVTDYVFTKTKDGISCSFTVKTTVGDINATV